jgi:uncharacterized protein (TIGR02266 family)
MVGGKQGDKGREVSLAKALEGARDSMKNSSTTARDAARKDITTTVRKSRRNRERAELNVKVEYRTLDSVLWNFSTNINEGGMFIRSNRPQPPGTIVHLRFFLPDVIKAIQVEGEVVWCNDDPKSGDCGMGIEFHELRGGDKRLIDQLLTSNRNSD